MASAGGELLEGVAHGRRRTKVLHGVKRRGLLRRRLADDGDEVRPEEAELADRGIDVIANGDEVG